MLHIFTLSQLVQHGQNGFTPKKHSSLDANSKAGSPAKLHNFKTQHHYGSQTVVLDNLKFLIPRDLLLEVLKSLINHKIKDTYPTLHKRETV